MTQQQRTSKDLHRRLPLIEATKTGLAKLPGYEGIVYRGADDVPEEFLAQHQVGAAIKYTAFTSASRDARAAFGCLYRFLIQAHGGAKDVSLLSAHKEEAEHLFPPDTCFVVLTVVPCGQALLYLLREQPGPAAPTREEDVTVWYQLREAARHLLREEAALSDAELLQVKQTWAGFRDKVESGCSACAPDEMSPYEAAKMAWEQEQARRERAG